MREVPLVGFAAWSGTGKTTLLRGLLGIFTERGLRVAVIKHAHHTFDIDHPGKDSYELRKAGASQVLVESEHRLAYILERERQEREPLASLVARLDRDALDLILVEGFKPEQIAKIELHRPSLGQPLLFPDDPAVIAVATDSTVPLHTDLPLLDLNHPESIADFIIDRFLKGQP
jgi:molybdopterin-guanine dinucleotide biosynthesis protein B